MSDMDYEKAWKYLKMRINILSMASLILVGSEDINNDIRLRAEGGEIILRIIRQLMREIEEEMTTAGQGDDQQAQD